MLLADAAFFRFLRGRGLESLIVSLRSARPNSSRFGYFREEAWAERGAAPLPNPFSLLHTLMAAADRSDVPARYMTVSQGGVTLWVYGEARECHTLNEWHHAHASFERVAHAPVFRRFRTCAPSVHRSRTITTSSTSPIRSTPSCTRPSRS